MSVEESGRRRRRSDSNGKKKNPHPRTSLKKTIILRCLAQLSIDAMNSLVTLEMRSRNDDEDQIKFFVRSLELDQLLEVVVRQVACSFRHEVSIITLFKRFNIPFVTLVSLASKIQHTTHNIHHELVALSNCCSSLISTAHHLLSCSDKQTSLILILSPLCLSNSLINLSFFQHGENDSAPHTKISLATHCSVRTCLYRRILRRYTPRGSRVEIFQLASIFDDGWYVL